MQTINSLISRNIKKYLRDKPALFFSFLSVLITILLYIFFLGKLQITSFERDIPDVIRTFYDGNISQDIKIYVYSWIIAGILAINTVTIPLSMVIIKVDDEYLKVSNDFNCTPAKRWQIVLGYILSAWIVSIITSIMLLIIGQIIMLFIGGKLLTFWAYIEIILILTLSTVLSSGFFYFIIMFLKSSSQTIALNGLVSALAGFIGGIYVPMGVLYSAIRYIVIAFPLSHIASLLRKVFINKSSIGIFDFMIKNGGANGQKFINQIDYIYGSTLKIGDWKIPIWAMIGYIVVSIAISYFLSFIIYNKRKNK